MAAAGRAASMTPMDASVASMDAGTATDPARLGTVPQKKLSTKVDLIRFTR